MIPLDAFFSIKRFAHRALWKEGESVWFALKHLDEYLEKQPLGKIEVEIPQNVHLVNPKKISIGKGTILEPGVMIQGPCILGEGCIVRHGAFLRDGVICGDRCIIGHSAEIKHSILLDSALPTHFTYVGDSIIGSKANLSAGVKCANLRLDRKEVVLCVEGKRMPTGLRKFGAIVGDGAQIGCNCVLNPGSLIGRGSVCFPLLNFSGYAPPHSCVKGSPNWSIESADALKILERIGR